MRRRTKRLILTLLTAAALGALVAFLTQSCQAQTICVSDPIVPWSTQAERQPLRQQVEAWIKEKGFQISCPAAWELVVEPISGKAYSDQIYFVAQVSDGVGTISLTRPSARFQSWMVFLVPAEKPLQGQYTLGHSLRGGVRKMLGKITLDEKHQKTYN